MRFLNVSFFYETSKESNDASNGFDVTVFIFAYACSCL